MSKEKTRLPNGMGSLRKRESKRKDGSINVYWEGRITVGRDPETGRPRSVYLSGKRKKEVLERMQTLQEEIRRGSYVEPTEMTLGEWMEIWLKEYQGSKKPMTVHNYMGTVGKHILPALGDQRLDRLTNLMLQRFYNSLCEGRHPLSPKSVKNVHGILHKALDQAVRSGLLRANPADNCVTPKLVQHEIKPMEPEEVTRFLKNLEGEPYRALFLTAFFTGMRQGELLGLSWDRVDFDTGIVEIRQQLQCIEGVYSLQTPKHDKVRIIAPVRLVMDALREERRKQEENHRRMGEAWQNRWNLVFTDETGKLLVRRTVDKHYKKILAKSGIEEHRFHDMRHTFAVSMLDAGEDLKSLQENLGHATAAFTLSQYAHVSQKMRMQSSKRMNEYFTKLMPEEEDVCG